jgi:replication factor C subunit 1
MPRERLFWIVSRLWVYRTLNPTQRVNLISVPWQRDRVLKPSVVKKSLLEKTIVLPYSPLSITQAYTGQGLTFVFTGVLDSLERDEAVNLVKRYGGKVTGAPSSKTSYVVLGSDAGPKKIETIRKNKIPTINEDGLFQLIRTLPAHGGSGKVGQAAAVKKEAEEKKMKELAREMDRQEKEEQKKAQAKKTGSAGGSVGAGQPVVETRLWTEKYAPTQIKDVIGNKSLVEKLQRWLREWPQNVKASFKKPGQDGLGLYRSVCLSGPPGIGKTTSAHLVAKLEGYDILEYNASDTRNEKLLRESLSGVTDNTSITGFMKHDAAHTGSRKLVLIMDEIDGMSGGDRGGVGALKKIIQQTKVTHNFPPKKPLVALC